MQLGSIHEYKPQYRQPAILPALEPSPPVVLPSSHASSNGIICISSCFASHAAFKFLCRAITSNSSRKEPEGSNTVPDEESRGRNADEVNAQAVIRRQSAERTLCPSICHLNLCFPRKIPRSSRLLRGAKAAVLYIYIYYIGSRSQRRAATGGQYLRAIYARMEGRGSARK